MSRIGKKVIDIPKDVSVKIENQIIQVKGKHGNLERSLSQDFSVKVENNKILIIPTNNENKKLGAIHGLERSLVQNMITGVSEKFSKTLVAEGVGYKFQVEKTTLILNVGYTHPVEFIIPSDLSVKLESPTKILISGIDKEKVGFLAAKVRDIRPPEPYKGKGILYEGEKIIRKAGKTGK